MKVTNNGTLPIAPLVSLYGDNLAADRQASFSPHKDWARPEDVVARALAILEQESQRWVDARERGALQTGERIRSFAGETL